MKPIIYGLEQSPSVRAIFLTCKAIGLDYDFKIVNPNLGENKTPEYLKMNPQHTIPTLNDDGKIVWESHAIATYLIGKYAANDSLYPKDLYQRALIDQRLHFNSAVLFNRLIALFRNRRANNGVASEEHIASVTECLEFMEAFLASNEYLVGNSLTVADLCCITSISAIELLMTIDEKKYPKLMKWARKIEQLPYYAEANDEGLEKLKNYFTKTA